jgi:hypothetical protein
VAGCKIHIKKSVVFLCINGKLFEKEIKAIPLTIAPIKIKYVA